MEEIQNSNIEANVNKTNISELETYLNYRPKYVIENTENVEIFGTDEQVAEMFKNWAEYMGEIQNPDNTADNIFLTAKNKSSGGNAALYAPLDEVLNNARPVLSKYGFGFFQSPMTKTGLASVKTILTHKSGAFISFPTLSVPTGGNTAQMVIAGITYARRGALNPIIGTHGENDDDGNLISGNDNKKPVSRKVVNTKSVVPQPVADKQKEIVSLCKELISGGIDREVVNTTLEDTCGSKNPNSVKDMKLLENAYAALDEVRNGNKEGK